MGSIPIRGRKFGRTRVQLPENQIVEETPAITKEKVILPENNSSEEGSGDEIDNSENTSSESIGETTTKK